MVVDVVALVFSRAVPHIADPQLAAHVVVATIESLVHRLVATAQPLDPVVVRVEITRLVVGYLEPAAGLERSFGA